jgi:hypothetical protein
MAKTTVANPFGVMDVPDVFDREVIAFAESTSLEGATDDDNARPWPADTDEPFDTIDGRWQSRWKGAADPTIPGDSADTWKQGAGELKRVGDRIYLKFDWNGGVREGLIEARREGPDRLVGKYINLSNPEITRPWVGLIIGNERIDGRFPEGRLDFRR